MRDNSNMRNCVGTHIYSNIKQQEHISKYEEYVSDACFGRDCLPTHCSFSCLPEEPTSKVLLRG
jgi:hypothetical protein